MGIGIIERVKKTFDKKRTQESPATSKTQRDSVLAEMTFEQATAMVAPDGPLDRARRPDEAAAKKAPDLNQALNRAVALAHLKSADGAARKDAPRVPATNNYLASPAPAKVAPAKQDNPYLASPEPAKVAPAKRDNPYLASPAPAKVAPAKQDNPYLKSAAPGSTTDTLVVGQAQSSPADSRTTDEVVYSNDPTLNGTSENTAGTPGPAEAELYMNAGNESRDEILEEAEELYQNDSDIAPSRHTAARAESHAEVHGMEAHAAPQHGGQRKALSDKDEAHIANIALAPNALETLRDAAIPGEDGPDRVALTEREQQQKGWALLPMMESQRHMDQTVFTTNYRYEDEDDLAENPGGTTQTTDRAETIVELSNGRFVFAASGQELDSKDLALPGFMIRNMVQARKAKLKRDLTQEESVALGDELKAAGGRFIFVMDSRGTIYAGESLHGVQHHSSFMGGGAVAAAGEMVLSGGKLKLISNQSGHYQPGPGFLWQAISQMVSQGVDMSGVTAEILGVGSMSAAIFHRYFNPVSDPELMKADYATKALKRYLGNDGQDVTYGAEGKQEENHV